jgi:hypothetical protein
MGFKARHPALHRASIFPKQFGDLPATVVAGDQRQPVQPMIVLRLIGTEGLLVWMARRMTLASAMPVFS